MIFLFISRRIWYTMNLVSHSIRGLDDQNNAIHKRGKRKMESSAACLNELRDLGTLTRKDVYKRQVFTTLPTVPITTTMIPNVMAAALA